MADPTLYVFPSREDRSWDAKDQKMGISLRDFFAAQALPSVILSSQIKTPDEAAKAAYAYADALLKKSQSK